MDWFGLGCSLVTTGIITARNVSASLPNQTIAYETDGYNGSDYDVPRSINYNKIIDELSDGALAFCVLHLNGTLFFYNRLIKKGNEENRSDYDLKTEQDKLLHMSRDDFKIEIQTFIKSHVLTSIKAHGTMNYYLNIISQYLEDILICKPGTRAEKYRNRALEAIDQAGKDGILESADDAFFVFAALLSTLSGDAETESSFIVGEPSFQLTGSAEEIFGQLSGNCKKIQKRFADERKSQKRKSQGHFRLIEHCPPETFIDVNNVLFLARALQNFGTFEEKHNG